MKLYKTLFAAALVLGMGSSVFAQSADAKKEKETEGFKFDTVKILPITSMKDQNQAGTCWCYSSMAFFEAELLRMGKPEYDFSEMYIVYHTYMDLSLIHI